MTALVLSVLFVAAPGVIQPDAALLAEARRLLRQQDYASALEVLDAAGPKGAQPEFLRYWAEAYVGLLDYPAAVAVLEDAPPEPESLALRIRLLAMLSRDDEAREVLAELLALERRLPDLPDWNWRCSCASRVWSPSLAVWWEPRPLRIRPP